MDLTIEKVGLFLLAVMPGVIAIKVYDLFYPPEKRDFGSSLFEAMAYSVCNLTIWTVVALVLFPSLWVTPLIELNRQTVAAHPILSVLGVFVFLVLSPVGLALLTVWVRNRPWVGSRIGYPNKTAWDDYFKRRQECWILFHLKSGKLLGGYYGPASYSSTFPTEQEVYVEEVWRVDQYGEFLEKVEGTLGMVIRHSECERLEFLIVQPRSKAQ